MYMHHIYAYVHIYMMMPCILLMIALIIVIRMVTIIISGFAVKTIGRVLAMTALIIVTIML